MDVAAGFLFLVLVIEIAFHVWERIQWSDERKELLQRIQSPELATSAYAREQGEAPEPVAPIALDDDQAYEKLRLEREGLAGG